MKNIQARITPNSYFISIGFCIVVVMGLYNMGCAPEPAAAYERDGQLIPSEQIPKIDRPTFNVISAQSNPYTAQVELVGKALAIKDVTLSASVPGIVDQVLVQRGQSVKEGELLIRLDQKGYRFNVQHARAALEASIVQSDQTKVETKRIQQLLRSGAAPEAAMDRTLAQQKGAHAQQKAAAVSLRSAKKALKDAEVVAPFNGRVVDIFVEEGENAPSMPPTMLVRMVQNSQLEVQIHVPEIHSSWTHVGNEATVHFDSANITKKGSVTFVSNVISPQTRTFEVRILVDNKTEEIKAGAFCTATLTKEHIEHAIFVPVNAIRWSNTGLPYVWFVNGDLSQKSSVNLGEQIGSTILIRKGILDGQLVIMGDVGDLQENVPINFSQI